MIVYKIHKAPEGCDYQYTCYFEYRTMLATHEYFLGFDFVDNEIEVIRVEAIHYGEYSSEDPEYFVKTHTDDVFWIRTFMRTYAYPQRESSYSA